MIAAFTVVPGDEVLLFSSAGNLVRTTTDEISEQGRDATGVRVARVAEGDTVVAVARVLEAENGSGDNANADDDVVDLVHGADSADSAGPVEEPGEES